MNPGILIVQVKEGSPADEAGIQEGDLIKEVNRKPVKDLKDLPKSDRPHKKKGGMFFSGLNGEG